MTTKTEIKLPSLPQPRIMPQDAKTKIAYGYGIDDMDAYARAAVEADRRAQIHDNAACIAKLSESDKQDQFRGVTKMITAESVLLQVLSVIQQYLPPGGLGVADAMGQIISLVDPWPLSAKPSNSGELERPAAPAPPADGQPSLPEGWTWVAPGLAKPPAGLIADAQKADGQAQQDARNWPEDARHENGNYQCICSNCGATFVGYKRRVTCKVCAQQGVDKVDAAFEAVRQQLCRLTRFSFYLGDGCVRREVDKSGNWLDFAEVHALFDPVSVDAARAQQGADREDAERYRWLRHGDNDELVLCRGPVAKDYVYLPRNEKLDAAIDTARAAKEQS